MEVPAFLASLSAKPDENTVEECENEDYNEEFSNDSLGFYSVVSVNVGLENG